MKILQSLLYKIQPPISFAVEISEPETRMTLKELCGSVWDDCDFNGEVYQTSFSFVKKKKANTRGVPRIALDGDFHEENGRTLVTIRPRISPLDIAGVIFSFLISGLMLLLGLIMIPFALTDPEILMSAIVCLLFGAGFCALQYFTITVSFRKSVEIIKTMLFSSERNRNHSV